ncbi:MAG: hypothetical protein AB2598_20640 [Candidatus Thiodiazotropha sp.]
MADLKYLKKIYFDPSHAGSFSGPEKLYQTVRKEGKFKIGRKRIKQFLENLEEYALQRDIKRKRKRRKVIVSGLDSQWGADLADVQSLSKSNEGIKFWLVVIDVFSKYLFVVTLKDKKASSVVEAFRKVLNQGRIPEVVFSDKGGELNNSLLKKEFQKYHIKYFTTQNDDIKNSIAERVIRTLRNKLYRVFQKQRSYRYIEILPDIVKGYNNTNHRSIGMAPVEVTKDNEAVTWDRMYNDQQQKKRRDRKEEGIKKPKKWRGKVLFKFKVGDYVRLAHSRYLFQRDYHQKWTTELFKVSERFLKENIALYRVVDLLNDPISGNFYSWELMKADQANEFWRVESILQSRKRKGKKEYLIKWEGYGDKFNSWVPASDVKDVASPIK